MNTHRAAASTNPPRSPVTRVRRSAQRGPTPLQNVASSTASWYTGGATISRSLERNTHTPRASDSSASSASSVATSCMKRASASNRTVPAASTSPRCTRLDARKIRPRPGRSMYSACTGSSSHDGLRQFRIKQPRGCAETLESGANMSTNEGATVSRFLEHLGRRGVRHRWWFIGVWIVAAISILALAGSLDGEYSDNFRIPDAQSQSALDLLEKDFPTAAGDSARVGALGKIPNVTSVTDPYGALGSAFISKSGDIAVVTVQFDTKAQDLQKDVFTQIEAATAPATKARVEVAYGGAVTDYADQPPSGNADLIGLLAAVVILLFAFGSVVAMGLPILTAIFGLVLGLSVVSSISSFTEIGSVAPTLATMIGLGVGIDYSLFIVTRYRESLATGLDVEAAVGRSVATAGSAVLFAGTTVVIAICGLVVSGIPYVARLGYMAGLVVAVMMLAALTLLPAIIGVVGHGIDRWKVPSLIHHPDRAVRDGRDPEPPAGTVWERWATLVARHAWPFAIGAVMILLVIAWPVLSMRLGESDDGNLPSSTTQRQAYDLVAEGFGPGTNGPLLLVVQLPAAGKDAVLTDIATALGKTPGVQDVLPEQMSPNGAVAEIGVLPTTAPDSAETADLVATLRSSVIPTAVGTSGAQAYVGGVTAAFIDIGD